MTIYSTVDGTKQLLDVTQWQESELDEQIITYDPSTKAWVNMQIGQTTEFTEVELAAEPIITMAANAYTVYTLLSTQLDSHHVENHSLAIRRLNDAKDLIRAYCLRVGRTPVFDAVDTIISGTIDFGAAFGTDGACI